MTGRIFNILLTLGIILSAMLFASCEKQSNGAGDFISDSTVTDTDKIYNEEDDHKMTETNYADGVNTLNRDAGADESVIIRADDYDVSGAVSLTSDEFLTMLVRDGDSYTIKPGVYRLTDYGVTFGDSFNGTSVNLTGVILLADGFDNVISITADNFELAGLTVSGANDYSVIVGSGENIIIKNCCFKGSLSAAISIIDGKNINISNCRIACVGGKALIDNSASGNNTFENNLISGCANTAVIIGSSCAVVMYNTVTDAEISVSITGENGRTENNLVAMNKVSGKMQLVNSDNLVLLKNVFTKETENAISVVSCSNITVADNNFTGTAVPINLESVNIALITGNSYLESTEVNSYIYKQFDSKNIYGNNIPGKLAGTEYTGTDESLLPVKDLTRFEKMESQDTIIYGGKVMTVDNYIRLRISEGGEIIIPPGVYSVSSTMSLSDRQNLDIYAYGVLFIFKDCAQTAIAMTNSNGVTIKGLTIDFADVPNAQGSVISNDGSIIIWKPDEGYNFDITDSTHFRTDAGVEGFHKGSLTPFCDIYNLNLNTGKNNDGTYTLHASTNLITGDKLTFRGAFAHVTYAEGCDNVLLEDITLWGGTGFGYCEVNGEGNSHLKRVLMTPGPKPEGASEERMLSVCDATHCTNMRYGIHVTDCKFEYMTDDGTNVNGTYGLIKDYDSNTNTITYNAGTTPEILAGDRIWVMTLEGRFLLDTTAVSIGDKGIIVIADDFEMPDGVGVFIENVSANGSGFCFENTVVEGNRSRGLVIKSTDGIITHCTINATGMTGILLKPEISDNWGECGYTENIVVSYNCITNSGYFDSGSDAQSAIAIRTDLAALDESYFSHRNITVIGNKIDGFYGGYAICLRGVYNAVIKDNILGARNAGINIKYPKDAKYPVYISGCAVLEISDNIYTGDPVSKIKINGSIPDISGNDLE